MSIIPQILSYGLSGLCAVLFILSFRLISQEQKRKEEARLPILRTITHFMIMTVISTVIVGFLGVNQIEKNKLLEDEIYVRNYNDDKDSSSTRLKNKSLSRDEVVQTVQTMQKKNDTVIKKLKNIDPGIAKKVVTEYNAINELQKELENISPSDTTTRRAITRKIIFRNNQIKTITSETNFKKKG